ncbi:hypothetical protein NUACC26_085760 [Scytonema sp. NUACC26]
MFDKCYEHNICLTINIKKQIMSLIKLADTIPTIDKRTIQRMSDESITQTYKINKLQASTLRLLCKKRLMNMFVAC